MGRLGSLSSLSSLRRVLFVAFALLALIPVGILALWLERSAYDKEVAEVSERHLLLAENLSHALDRYSKDAQATFELAMAELLREEDSSPHLKTLLANMGFVHACILDRDGNIQLDIRMKSRWPGTGTLTNASGIRALAVQNGNTTIISGVMPDAADTPMLFLARDLGDGRLGLGALSTDYIVEVQRAIAFGDKGHSAIVDQHGRVLAHPNEDWRMEMKNISALLPVQKMMAGETGVAQFYSPAVKADMIAGYTSASHTGWGVMVPQPISELEYHAQQVFSASLYIGLAGFLIAVVLAWYLSRRLAAPIEKVAEAARIAGAGNLDARLELVPGGTPNEIRDMAQAFNQMLHELQVSNERLVRAADEAEATSKAKSHFMANMSHEFRTPLNAIMGYADAMRSHVFGPLGDPRYQDYAGNVHDAGAHLLRLVEEILELTRIEAGRMNLQIASTPVSDCVAFAVELLAQKALEGGIDVQTDLADDLPLLQTDGGKLRQALLNLLSNAIKFTHPGGFARIEATSDTEWAVVIRVIDNGVGISPSDVPEVMKPYGKVANAFAGNQGGTGLGLPLTRELTELMGGEFSLGHIDGGGTVATIRLPRVAPEPAVTA